MWTFLIIYILGYIVSYALLKWGRYLENENGWEEIAFAFKISFLSWFAVLLEIGFLINFFYKRLIEDNDPPPWL